MITQKISLSVAHKIAQMNQTTLDYINMNGGDFRTKSGAKLVVQSATSNGKFKCVLISFTHDQSDIREYRRLLQ